MKIVIIFLVMLYQLECKALIPIEGLIYGKVEESKQYDPFNGVISFNYTQNYNILDEQKVNYLYALYKQGYTLKNTCEISASLNYSSSWEKASAARSVVGTLQYIGIDYALKALVSYAKELEIPKNEFLEFSQNMIENSCTPNLSVYSLKLLKNNFVDQWENGSFQLPTIKDNPFFEASVKTAHNTREVKNREFNYTLKNFKAFCSWNGDTEDYRLLVPYIKNPFIMSIVFNHMQKKKILLDKKTEELILVENRDGIQVACEDLICRSRNEEEFKKIFPRMQGSGKLSDDLNNLYCAHFSNQRYQRKTSHPVIKEILKDTTGELSKIEAMHFLSLITKLPEPTLIANKYNDISKFLRQNIKERWNKWADKKIKTFHNDHLYEEPLEITLIEKEYSEKFLTGNFNLEFNIGLSEVDKVLTDLDKIDTLFYFEFSKSYIGYLKERIAFHFNRGEIDSALEIENKLVQNILIQLKKKNKYFKIPIYTEEIAQLMGVELLRQIEMYRGKEINPLASGKIRVPVKFKFGIFALQYIMLKKKFKEKEKTTLTFK